MIRDAAGRFTLADLGDDGTAATLFPPTELDRLVLFASWAALGHPSAITHPKAVLFLATLALALVAVLKEREER